MKIAFLSTFYPFRGGIAQFNANLFRELEKEHEIKAFNFSVQYPRFLFPGKTQYVDENDNADKIPSKRILNAVNPLSYRKTVKEIQAFQPDLLIIGYWMPYMAPALGYVAKKIAKETKVLSIIHNAMPHEKGLLDKLLANYFFKNNKYCIALSKAVGNDLNKFYPDIETKVLPHPNYKHFGELLKREEALQILGLESTYKYVLFFGLIRDYKGLDLLLEAMTFLPEDIHLIVAGEVYGKFDNYEKIINQHNLGTRIHLFLNYIPDEEVKVFFSATSIVALPYKSGTQSGIVAIAKHFNKPVLATDVGGLPEFISNENGIVVPKSDIKKMGEGLLELLQQNHASSVSKNEISWEEFGEELIRFVV